MESSASIVGRGTGLFVIDKAPKAVGFKRNAYTLTGLMAGSQNVLEDKFFKPVDQRASAALSHMVAARQTQVSPVLRQAFSTFLVGFFHRTPEAVGAIIERYVEGIQPAIQGELDRWASGERGPLPDGQTIKSMKTEMEDDIRNRRWGGLLRRLIDSKYLLPRIMNMMWSFRELPKAEFDLLTSDRPLISNNGFGKPEGHLALPVGPRLLFLATNTHETRRRIFARNDNQLSRIVNDEIVRRTQEYVYGTDDSQLAFVEARLRRHPIP